MQWLYEWLFSTNNFTAKCTIQTFVVNLKNWQKRYNAHLNHINYPYLKLIQISIIQQKRVVLTQVSHVLNILNVHVFLLLVVLVSYFSQ